MKTISKYALGVWALVAATAGFTSCQDDFDDPTPQAPVASKTPNTTILELKTLTWDDATNYIDTIGTKEWYEFVANDPAAAAALTPEERRAKRLEGEHIIIHGRVISSDEQGNVFKSLIIQDETAALAMSINSYNLYLTYRVGQEVVIDATGMYIGKYNGLQQLGYPEWYANGNAWEATFMSPEFFKPHVEANGWPEPEKVDTLEVNSFAELSTNPDGLRYWQSRLVKFNNVEFVNGGVEKFSEYHSSGVNQSITDKDGASLIVRTSGYSTFWNNTLPTGRGDVVAILSYYGTSGWQLLLLDLDGCMNFGNPTIGKGGKDNPYTTEEALAQINDGSAAPNSVWVSGYIVGTIAPEVTEITSNNDIDWGTDPTLNNSIVIGATPDTRDIAHCIVIAAPTGSDLQKNGTLRDNPTNLGKAIKVTGKLGKYLGAPAITDNRGTSAEFEIEGMTPGGSTGGADSLSEDFEGGAIPDTWANVQIAGTNDWYATSFNNNYYAAMTGYKGTAPFDSWLISPAIDMTKVADKVLTFDSQVNGYGSTTTIFEVYVLNSTDPATATKTKLNPTLATAPSSGYSDFVSSGNVDLSQFTGTIHIGFRYYATNDANYATWCIDNVKVGTTAGGDTPDPDPTPDTPVTGTAADFNTMNGGTPISTYGTYTSAQGWKAVWAQILAGSSTPDNKTTFEIFGDAFAVVLNGRTSKQGILTSPTITGGIGKLTFDYCQPYTDTKCKLTINIKQGGNVVATDVLTADGLTKLTKYSYSHDFNISGDFSIEIVNDCPSANDTANKDRVAIYNLTWTKN